MFDYISHPSKWFGTSAPVDVQKARDFARWNIDHIDRNAGNIKDAFFGCDYIIEVDWKKIFQTGTASGTSLGTTYSWALRKEFAEEYTYPFRETGDHSSVVEMRGLPDKDNIFVTNAFGGDHVFVGTNNAHDATMIGLRYS